MRLEIINRLISARTAWPSPTWPFVFAALFAASAIVEAQSTIEIQLELASSGLADPVGLAHAGDGSGRLFVVERQGRIRVLDSRTAPRSLFLDITNRVRSAGTEQGLLGLAFHPNFRGNGFFYVNYTNHTGATTVSRFTAPTQPGPVNPSSEVVLLTVSQPAENHNGGHLAFGPDGYLYIGNGDGGGGGDSFGNGQNGLTLLGALLRIDVDRGFPYAIPADNPFVGDVRVRNEIWALGLRNPWRYSFDRLSGDLYIADVGQNQYEELNIQRASSWGGENYGWPLMEGKHCFPIGTSCNRNGLTLPIVEYNHTQGCSITGGYVYRGAEFPSMLGVYVFGDFCSGKIWGLLPGQGTAPTVVELGQFDILITSFGEDEPGELYVLNKEPGELYRLRPRLASLTGRRIGSSARP